MLKPSIKEDEEEPNLVTPEIAKKVDDILKEFPRLDWLMGYALVTTPPERLREIFAEAKTVDPPADFLDKAVVTIE